ncbi:MAG: hypothetical protein KF832_26555 [Caldilineaceae bacterium]|nr:hypothetical protein [Caldilineaceae bacterium]
MKEALVNLAWRLLGAFLGLLFGTGLAIFLGDAIGKALNISNFEGGRGYFVLFVILPLFALTGAILGAVMIYLKWQWNLLLGSILFVAIGGFLFINRYEFIPAPPQVETVGNFELLTYRSENWGNYYQLRYQGELFTFPGRAGIFGDDAATYQTFNAVITFTQPVSNTGPVFVVNVGDPNNSSFFYLVREVAGQAAARYLGPASGNVAADWLDVPPMDPTATRDLTLRRGQLEGGRWLLLGDNCVLDVQTLTAYPFETYPLHDGADASLNQFKLPLGLSPDQQSLVRLGSREIRDAETGDFRGWAAVLMVYNFVDGTSYTLPIDRARMRYAAVELIDAAWLDHHFTWQPTAGAPDRLVQRPNFSRLPYTGRLTGTADSREYRIVPVKAELLDQMVSFLEENFAATQLEVSRYDTSTYIDFQIGEEKITVSYADDSYSEPQLSLWAAEGSDQLIATIGQRFDEVLRTGVYDEFFLGDPATVTAALSAESTQ